ncbi:ribosome biogenesis factor YjgA [Thalassotalea sp. 1_MG-2023]|uniref:ribosome biogenesis factor YjgA n=1 Tax=Thalassotalea sp. 1_MG-2023 TaxID=3062680 RepID=UPI0026E49335|nr:ribosome biogenesis factor YjgA [Thalassotalea sp. 1_MG-2023]MDO6427062.1 ribosome biogenesis factor YjgA [Thalassotalea sp. 1_MG-2023]
MPQYEHDIDEFDEDYKSKTEIKREMHAMQDFAMKLVKLSKAQRAKVPFPEEILEALALADKIKNKPEALRRHVRFMSKVLLETDLTDVNQALDVMANKHQQDTSRHLRLEQLRDDLITQGNDKIEAMLEQYPAMERQKLRQLVRQATKEHNAEKPGKSYRDLFAYIKEHAEE